MVSMMTMRMKMIERTRKITTATKESRVDETKNGTYDVQKKD